MSKWMKVDPATLKVGDEVRMVDAFSMFQISGKTSPSKSEYVSAVSTSQRHPNAALGTSANRRRRSRQYVPMNRPLDRSSGWIERVGSSTDTPSFTNALLPPCLRRWRSALGWGLTSPNLATPSPNFA